MGIRGRPCRSGDISTSLDDPVERAAIHDQVLDHGERLRPPRLDIDDVAVREGPHMQLAGRRLLGTVRHTIDHQAALAADALAAVTVEGDGVFASLGEALVQHIEHLQKRHVPGDAVELVRDHLALGIPVRLPPYPYGDIHALPFWLALAARLMTVSSSLDSQASPARSLVQTQPAPATRRSPARSLLARARCAPHDCVFLTR